jgi:parallel beta-helix repeat protein
MPLRLRRRPAVARRVRPSVEVLEGRALPSTTVLLHAGDSIQHAVDAATAGTTILLAPGTYKQTVTVDSANIKLVGLPGKGGVVLQNPGWQADGVTVTPNGGGFELDNVTVRGFDADGVLLEGVNGFRLEGVHAVNNHDYGLFPVLSAHGVIEGCAASGSNDTGIYVGQSSAVTVRDCVVHDNVNGIEVENCTGVTVKDSVAYANTVGIFVDLLPAVVPGISVTTSSQDVIADNLVVANNRANTADPSDIAAAESPGVGILVVGGGHPTVKGNLVLANGTGGIVVLSGLDLIALRALPAGAYDGLDPNPEHLTVRDNLTLGNGLHPADPTQPHADLIASPNALMASDNHWIDNVFATSFPPALP